MIKCFNCGGVNDDCAEKCVYCHQSIKPLSDEELFQEALTYKNGVVGGKGAKKAEEILTKLATKGFLGAFYELGELLINTDRERAMHIWKMGAEKGDELCIKRLKIENIETTTTADNEQYVDLIEKALPNVVKLKVLGLAEKTSIDKAGKKKVEVCIGESRGSGFIVDGGYIVTNFHVVKDCLPFFGGMLNADALPDYPCKAYFEPSISKETYFLEPVAFSQENDIAVLCFKDSLTARKFAKRKNFSFNTEALKYGQEVFTIGNPLGLGLSAMLGYVACPSRKKEEWESAALHGVNLPEAVQVTFPVNPGNSGGALLNKNNEVVGMTTFGPSGAKGGVDMCVPAYYIKNLVDAVIEAEDE